MQVNKHLRFLETIARPGAHSRDLRKRKVRRAAQVEAVRKSALFDAQWYLAHNPEVGRENMDPAVHYVFHGAAEGRWPHPLFHGDFYLANSPEMRPEEHNPLLHYIEHGAREGRNPNPLFDTHWYVRTHMRDGAGVENPLAHFIANGGDPSPAFDAGWYAKRYLNGSVRPAEALAHYFLHGRAAGHFPNQGDAAFLDYARDRIRRAGLFDQDYYVALYPPVLTSGMDPLDHYILEGAYNHLRPHPLFDVDWYAHMQQPSLDGLRINPLLHFLEEGAATGRNPNGWFDTAWYATTYPDSLAEGGNTLDHFMRHGRDGNAPGPLFDARAYLDENDDVARTGMNPLIHYMQSGIREGRTARLLDPERYQNPVTDAALVCLKRPERVGATVALLVTHAPNGRLKGHVEHYIRSLRANDVDVILIAAAGRNRTAIPASVVDLCAGVFVRENQGFDFAAWAHVLLAQENLLGCKCLFLTNDSIIGPLDEQDFARLIRDIREDAADLVGTTDNVHYAWHLQSFLLACKAPVLASYAFAHFLTSVVNLANKDHVITQYELTFTMRMRAAGFATKALFPMAPSPEEAMRNPTGNRAILAWEQMLREGFPFVKASLVIGEHRIFGGEAVREALTARGFDLDRLDPNFLYPGPKVWANLAAPAACAGRDARHERIAYFGPTNYANGLGVAARGYLRSLYRLPRRVNVHPTRRPFHVHARVAPDWQVASFSGPADVAVVHINGDGWDNLLDAPQQALVAGARRRIGLFVWETSALPLDWLPVLDRVDAIWTPTTFCAEIFRAVTDVPVHVVPHVVESDAPAGVGGGVRARVRSAYGIDPKRRIILYAFDGSSFLARKNPFALVRAFRASGLYRQGWQLVLKTKHITEASEDGQRLLQLAGEGPDVVMINRPMSEADLRALFEIAEIYASSHSSEGFGLTIAEAMEQGKLVVATDYGGSRDFLDATCGFPVRAETVALTESYGPYLRGAAWGLVDEADLARSLKDAARAAEDGSGAAIGAAARARIRAQLSGVAVARAMEVSLAKLDTIWGGQAPQH